MRAPALVLLSSLAIAASTSAEDTKHKATATVSLIVPYQTILSREVVRFTVRLHNDSKGEIRYIRDPFEAGGKQVFISVERGDPSFRDVVMLDSLGDLPGGRVLTVERDGNWDVVEREATGVLRGGEAAQWDGSRFSSMLFYITDGKPKSIQAQVLIGPSQWVSSKQVPIKVIHTDLSSCPIVFEGFYLYSFRGSPKTKEPVKIHRVSIEGTEYLFSSECARICEIPRGCIPEFACDPETAVLTVRFPGTDVPPIRYHYPQMKVLPARPADAPQKP
jgi:hypothetical protein